MRLHTSRAPRCWQAQARAELDMNPSWGRASAWILERGIQTSGGGRRIRETATSMESQKTNRKNRCGNNKIKYRCVNGYGNNYGWRRSRTELACISRADGSTKRTRSIGDMAPPPSWPRPPTLLACACSESRGLSAVIAVPKGASRK